MLPYNRRWTVTHKYTGQELDGESELYYYNARYYDPSLGRFLTADTIIPNPRNLQAFNRYSYVYNSPIKYTDPTGHKPLASKKKWKKWKKTKKYKNWKKWKKWKQNKLRKARSEKEERQEEVDELFEDISNCGGCSDGHRETARDGATYDENLEHDGFYSGSPDEKISIGPSNWNEDGTVNRDRFVDTAFHEIEHDQIGPDGKQSLHGDDPDSTQSKDFHARKQAGIDAFNTRPNPSTSPTSGPRSSSSGDNEGNNSGPDISGDGDYNDDSRGI